MKLGKGRRSFVYKKKKKVKVTATERKENT